MILLDTSAIYALADRRDANQPRATSLFRSADESGEPLLLHSYIISEAASLLQRRLGLAAALAFVHQVADFAVTGSAPRPRGGVAVAGGQVPPGPQPGGLRQLRGDAPYGITQALAFDADFEREGFALYAGEDV